jgi:pimeloyl-ACP methyl ester carboxylesterase
MVPTTRGMIQTVLGAIGYLAAEPANPSSLTPLLCFHSSPRNTDEFLEVLPLLATGNGEDHGSCRRVIALDVPGYGMSENPTKSCTVDEIADAFLQVADALQIDKFVAVGSLMGNLLAISLASRYPDRVTACVCANLYFWPQTSSEEIKPIISTNENEGKAAIPDSFVLRDDGSHLVELHNKRSKWLPPELNLRVVSGELTYLVNRRARYAKGIKIQDLSGYDFASAASKTTCPTLCIRGEASLAFFDMIGLSGTERFEAGCKLLSDCEVASLAGETSTLNMINQEPVAFTSLCLDYLKKKGL